MTKILRYLRLWLLFAKYELMFQFSTKIAMVFFFIGKVVRFFSFIIILLLIKQNTNSLAGYTINEVLIFFLTFNFIDLVSQMFLRGVYSLSGKVRSGEFDFFLCRPVNPLFRSLAGSPDFNDIILFIPLTAFSVWYIVQSIPMLSWQHFMLYLLFLCNGLLISVSFHILVLCVGVITAEVDNTIMFYRDLTQMGRFPIEIYKEPLRSLITFVIPIGIMISTPAKTLLGLGTTNMLFLSMCIGVGIFALSLKAWGFALKKYTSASS